MKYIMMSLKWKHLFLIMYSFLVVKVTSQNFTLGNCLKNTECENCPKESMEWDILGQPLCCPKCRGTPAVSSENISCVCLQDPNNKSSPSSRIIFQGMSKEIPRKQNTLISQPIKNYDQDTTTSLKRTIGVMSDTIENIDFRLRLVEETLRRMNPWEARPTPAVRSSLVEKLANPSPRCKGNFIEVGGLCIFASVYTNQKANWKDAKSVCEKMEATLVEVSDHEYFVAVTTFLSSMPTTVGHSYWVGGIFPGAMWIWVVSGKKVTMNSSYWTPIKRTGKGTVHSVVAGDIINGRCLGLHYIFNNRGYGLSGDECAYENYFLCQKNSIEKGSVQDSNESGSSFFPGPSKGLRG